MKHSSKIPHILTDAGRTADIMKQGFTKPISKKTNRKKTKQSESKYGWLGEDFFTKGW